MSSSRLRTAFAIAAVGTLETARVNVGRGDFVP